MTMLNKSAAEAIANVDGVHACTDITGFGLAGHASEMAEGSKVTIEIDTKSLPIIPGVLDIASENKSGGMKTNKDHFGSGVDYCSEIPDAVRDLLFDPQTSGGLLISVSAESAARVASNLEKAGIRPVFVGSVSQSGPKRLRIC